jgi:hypothetical protein
VVVLVAVLAVVVMPAAWPVLVIAMPGIIMMMSMIIMMMGCIIGFATVMMRMMRMMRMAVVVAAVGLVGAALGAERAPDGRRRAALAADHLGQDVVVLDPDRVGADLGRRVPVADVPGDPHQPQRILGPDLEERLGRRLHLHEAPVLEPHCIAVGKRRRLIEVEEEVEPALPFQRHAAPVPALMIEDDRVGDPVGLHGGLADDGGGAEHANL